MFKPWTSTSPPNNVWRARGATLLYDVVFNVVEAKSEAKTIRLLLNPTERFPEGKTFTIKFLPESSLATSGDKYQFRKGDKVLVFIGLPNEDGTYECGLLWEKGVAFRFGSPEENAGNTITAGMIERIRRLLELPQEQQELVFRAFQGPTSEKDPFTPRGERIEFPSKRIYSERGEAEKRKFDLFFDSIKQTLSPEQRLACERWILAPDVNKNKQKIDFLLNISPVSPYREFTPTYESVKAVLDMRIEGHEEMKDRLARFLAGRQQKKDWEARGSTILIVGPSGTGKSTWERAIAEALHVPTRCINLSTISSILGLFGDEAQYESSSPGTPLKFMSDVRTSEVCLAFSGYDDLNTAGDRGRDGNVAEGVAALVRDGLLIDRFADDVPLHLTHTTIIMSVSRVDSLSADFRSSFDFTLELQPFGVDLIKRIVEKHLPQIQNEYGLKPGWITAEAIQALMDYRSDLGAKSIMSHLHTLALSAANESKVISEDVVREQIGQSVNGDDPIIRFHRFESLYPEEQRKAIMDAVAERDRSSHLSSQEKRALKKKLDYLTRLVPKPATFDPDALIDEVKSNMCEREKEVYDIAADLYSASMARVRPAPRLFVGPYGVGKTSLSRAIANAYGTQVVSIQLNGMRDVSVLKGHSPQAVAADAGAIVRGLAAHETSACILLLDELDKASPEVQQALVDLLDDSASFYDEFLETYVDLSGCMIIATANSLGNILPVIQSRCKISRLDGYTPQEKKEIAKTHLLPAIVAGRDITVEDAVFNDLVRRAKDAGMREVKHDLATVINRKVMEMRGKPGQIRVTLNDVERILGPHRAIQVAENAPGCVNGLGVIGDCAGMVLPIRVTLCRDNQRRVTGLPQQGIRESIALAETWLETVHQMNLTGYHAHLSPAGIEKDGPSAGVAIAVAIYSAMTSQAIGRRAAFTGEFDGYRILPVGGVKLKTTTAELAGLDVVYLPEDNRRDIDPDRYGIEIKFVSTIEEVITDLFPKQQANNKVTAIA